MRKNKTQGLPANVSLRLGIPIQDLTEDEQKYYIFNCIYWDSEGVLMYTRFAKYKK